MWQKPTATGQKSHPSSPPQDSGKKCWGAGKTVAKNEKSLPSVWKMGPSQLPGLPETGINQVPEYITPETCLPLTVSFSCVWNVWPQWYNSRFPIQETFQGLPDQLG